MVATGVSGGAPPDEFNQLGQDWSQPPWRPDELMERAYEPFRAVVRAVLRHAGGVRIDQVPPRGAHVRHPGEDLPAGVEVLASGTSILEGAALVGQCRADHGTQPFLVLQQRARLDRIGCLKIDGQCGIIFHNILLVYRCYS